jgi:hypothetical protein
MKKSILNVLFCLTVITILSSCDKKNDLENQKEINPRTISFMEAGRLKASSLSLQKRPISESQQAALLLRKSQINSSKLVKSRSANIVKSNSNLKSQNSIILNNYRLTQVERYASNCYPEGYTFYEYDANSRVIREDYYSDYDQDGNYTWEGCFMYTYLSGYSNIEYANHYNGSGDWDYYYYYGYLIDQDGYDPRNRIDFIDKVTLNAGYVGYKRVSWDHPMLLGDQVFSANNVSLYRREFDVTAGGFKQVRGYDSGNTLYYVENYTYYGVEYTHRIKQMNVSARYTGATFDYFPNSANLDVVCYSPLRPDGSFNTAWVYRYDTSQKGNYDPFIYYDCLNFKNF